MYILDYIPTGHNNAITREALQSLTHLSDRKIRVLIAEANKSAPDDVLIINLQDGMGYFRLPRMKIILYVSGKCRKKPAASA